MTSSCDKTETGSSVPDEDEMDEVTDEAIGAKLNILYTQKRAVSSELAAAHAREKKIADENKSLKHKVRKSILGEAEIVVTTLNGCGGDIYGICSETASTKKYGNFSEQALFDVVVINEAAQALEPATLIPLQLLESKETKCIMVGDPKQLPATILASFSMSAACFNAYKELVIQLLCSLNSTECILTLAYSRCCISMKTNYWMVLRRQLRNQLL